MNQQETEQKQRKVFIYYLTHNRCMTRKQRERFNRLVARDCAAEKVSKEMAKPEKKVGNNDKVFTPLSPKDTANILNLFNQPTGLKYLTHDFDQQQDGRPQTISELISTAKKVFTDINKNRSIPSSLKALLGAFIIGPDFGKGKGWFDTYYKKHTSYIESPEWIAWSDNSQEHPIHNTEFSEEIQAFRATIRLIPGQLTEIVKMISATDNFGLNITTEKIEKADFYVNTAILHSALKKILTSNMNAAADQYPDVTICYKPTSDQQGHRFSNIIITQKNSYSPKDLKEVRQRLNTPGNESGDFYSIRELLNGYCKWSVVTEWGDGLQRWNILKEPDNPEVEKLETVDVPGFTHILSFNIV